MKFAIPGIYPITDPYISGLSHLEQVKRLTAGGAKVIQLRDKHASSGDLFQSACSAVEFARHSGAAVIVNDRIDIALASGAAGVHLGQDDAPVAAARSLLGEGSIIGLSTHTIEQALSGAEQGADYIAFGPVYDTRTKANPDATVGLEQLDRVRKLLPSTHLVAIGGIDESNMKDVYNAGADSVALINSIISEPSEIESRMRRLLHKVPNV